MTAQDEAEGAQTITIEWRGEAFTLPASPDDWPIEALEAFEERKAVRACRLILSDTEWERMKKLGGSVRDFKEFMDVAAAAFGFEDSGK